MAQEKMETGSVISTDSDVSGMFLTKTKTKKNKNKANDDIDSPTARAAKALMMLNHKEDQALALVQKRAMDSSDSEADDEEKMDVVQSFAYSKMTL